MNHKKHFKKFLRFKVIIFTPGNEELMARILEVLLPGKVISKLEFRPTEQQGLAF